VILPDVNVLVYAFRREADQHRAYADWLSDMVAGAEELALHDPVLAGFVRIVTHPRVVADPAPVSVALDFVAVLRRAVRGRWLPSGHEGWDALRRLTDGDPAIRANLVPDAHLAAVALAHGCTVATADRGFARFPGLRFFDPVRAAPGG
jgi:uncharacterized protein